jgi:hypothetical protein
MEIKVEELEKKQGDLLESVRKMRAELAGLLPTQSALEKRTYDTCVAANLSSFVQIKISTNFEHFFIFLTYAAFNPHILAVFIPSKCLIFTNCLLQVQNVACCAGLLHLDP